MATKARRAGSLAGILNANTSSASNTIVIDSGGDISLSGSLTVSGTVSGAGGATVYATNAYLQATFAQNTYVSSLGNDKLQVANAEALYVTKATALTSNNALINLINDRYQVANADATFLTKSVGLTTNTALLGLINDRIQAANVNSTLGLYWPSANVIAYTDSSVSGSTKTVNTSIFVATGGENKISIPYTNTNFILVYLNGVLLTEDTDYVAANNVHIGGIDPPLVEGDVVVVEEYKNHNANTINRSAGAGGGYGYTAGDNGSPGDVIDKFPFSADANATDVGDLTVGRFALYGQSSTTSGYSSGGALTTGGAAPTNVIDKFPFSADTNATDVGDLTVARRYVAGQSSSTNGYTSGGACGPSPQCNIIDKFPFASDANATDVGNLTQERRGSSGQNSSTHGYTSGGIGPTGKVNIIDKFSFSSDGNATNVGDLDQCMNSSVGHSSSTDGYAVGGTNQNSFATSAIRKFPFASDTNSTNVCSLLGSRWDGAGQSSSTNGYTSGGAFPACNTCVIGKYPFASDGNETFVGNLTDGRGGRPAGHQS